MTNFIKISSILLTLLIGYVIWTIAGTPNANRIKDCIVTNTYKIKLCSENPDYVRLTKISPLFKNIVIIAEDASFYSHNGFDLVELKRSFDVNLSEKKIARGGSTITQQLAKNVFLNFDKTISRKIREALITEELEKILTKDQILEKYLNIIELGPKIFGIGPAARFYFGKSPAGLNLLESAFMTYLIPNPKVHHRVFLSKKLTPYARYRILDLCYRMYRFRKISLIQYEAAKKYVDLFPWTSLTDEEINDLNGINAAPMDVVTEPLNLPPNESLPEQDMTLEYAEPSHEEMYEPEENIERLVEPAQDDSPFEK